MSGRIVQLDASTHRTVQELLPWFVADTLDGEDLAAVQAHLHQCSQCQADVDWQRKLHAAEPPSRNAPDVERALARLRPRIQASQSGSTRNVLLEILQRLLHDGTPWMRRTLAVQFVAILGLAFLLISLSHDGTSAYRALGMPKSTAAGNVVIVFKPDTAEQDLRRILRASGARVVDGPTVTDAYLLSVPSEKLAQTVDRLKSERAVTLVESLKPEGEP